MNVVRRAGLRCILTTAMIWTFYSCSPVKDIRVEERFGKKIAFVNKGNGSPTIVWEAGFDAGMATWGTLLDTLSQYTEIYAYDRPGYGKSNKSMAPQSVREVAEQLYANLVTRDIEPPYVLVGHNEGALMINMFARLYPELVSGVLMIEPIHPDYYDYIRENEALIYDILIDFVGKGQRLYEFDIIKGASAEFKNAPPFPDIPITILMAGRHRIIESETLRQKTLEFNEELKSMSSIGQRFLVQSSVQYIHKQNPDRVIEEILRLIQE